MQVNQNRQSAETILSLNLVVARAVSGMTQQKLAEASGVSRATIAQIETGVSDPRLSTLADLAEALRIVPMVLLAGTAEVTALSKLTGDLSARAVRVSGADVARMQQLLSTGMLADRRRAARIGGAAARVAGETGAAATVAAAIFSAVVPGAGTAAGIALGRLLEC